MFIAFAIACLALAIVCAVALGPVGFFVLSACLIVVAAIRWFIRACYRGY